jgi:hypothetical protein
MGDKELIKDLQKRLNEQGKLIEELQKMLKNFQTDATVAQNKAVANAIQVEHAKSTAAQNKAVANAIQVERAKSIVAENNAIANAIEFERASIVDALKSQGKQLKFLDTVIEIEMLVCPDIFQLIFKKLYLYMKYY